MLNQELKEAFKLLIVQTEDELKNNKNSPDYTRNTFRLKSFNNFLKFLKKYPKEITSGKQLKGITNIGKGMIDRVDEILSKGTLKEIKKSTEKKSKDIDKIESLTQIIGIGNSLAEKLIEQGIESADDLMKKVKSKKIEVNDKIKIGLKYHNLYKQQIPRKEMDKIADLLYDTLEELFDEDAKGKICGSYRRGKSSSNDIDFLFVHKKIKTKDDLDDGKNIYLAKFIKILHDTDFLVGDLADGQTKYMGFCQLSTKYDVRRIDIRLVPYYSYYSAILYFTGSGDFNKKMRIHARKEGYKLNEYGLYKLSKNKTTRITIESEKDIFDELDMDYVKPVDRN